MMTFLTMSPLGDYSKRFPERGTSNDLSQGPTLLISSDFPFSGSNVAHGPVRLFDPSLNLVADVQQ